MTTPTVPADDVDLLLTAVDGHRMAATVAELAGAAFAGRRVGTPGGAAARAWLGQRLDDLDATVSFGTFSVRAVPEVYAAPAVSWNDGARGGHRVACRRQTGYSFIVDRR